MRYLSNVTTLKYSVEKCVGCKMCTIVCPHQIFEMQNEKASITDIDKCMECGACEMNCPSKAITVKSGVGCASGIIKGALTGTEPTCDCDKGNSCC